MTTKAGFSRFAVGDGELEVRRLMREIHVLGEHAELRVRHLDEGLRGQSAREGKGQEKASDGHGFSW